MIHLRAHLDEHLQDIRDDVVKMGRKVQRMLEKCCALLRRAGQAEQEGEAAESQTKEGGAAKGGAAENQTAKGGASAPDARTADKSAPDKSAPDASAMSNEEAAQAIIKEDKYVDIYEMSIDDHCLQLIATEQPVASDLRKIISITKLTSDLERIGDIARYIARTLRKDIPDQFKEHVPQIAAMYETGIEMFIQAIAAFVDDDEAGARQAAAKDDAIDEQHREIQRAIIRDMKSEPEYIKNGQRLLEITRLIELLGDRATSICEWTIFSTQGKHIDLN